MSPRESKITPNTLFGKRIKVLQKNQSIRSFEAKCNLSNGYIAKVYKGLTPSGDALVSICMATGCDANWLLLGKGEPFPDRE